MIGVYTGAVLPSAEAAYVRVVSGVISAMCSAIDRADHADRADRIYFTSDIQSLHAQLCM